MRNVRYKKLFGQSLLALSVVGVLSACNSSGGSDNDSTPLPDASYACQANVMEQSNQLRTYWCLGRTVRRHLCRICPLATQQMSPGHQEIKIDRQRLLI